MCMQIRVLGALLAVLSGSCAWASIDLTSPAMTRERLLTLFSEHPEVMELDQVPAILPADFRENFLLKHGIKRVGERGHLVETKVSQSADPLAPRAILFDERTGFSVSYNGCLPTQTAGQRLDVMSFDETSKTFHLEKIDFPIQAGHPELSTSDCMTCHGPHERPIFAMYPDWPSFYGSDNDELTRPKAVQEQELANYTAFTQSLGAQTPRYTPLFDKTQTLSGVAMWPTYPFRPDFSEVPTAVSRAFAFRPNLRAGIVYNRLTAQMLEKMIFAHPNFKNFGAYFLFDLYECTWSPSSKAKIAAWRTRLQNALPQTQLKFHADRLDYRQLWALFGLTLNDVDIRYSYNHPGYANENAHGKIMQVGYIGDYFNSYFDGSTTIDELVSAAVYNELSKDHVSLKGVAVPRGLDEKYSHFVARYQYDRDFFRQMDSMGKWLAIPYPTEIASPQHRELFTSELRSQHVRLCHALENGL